MMFHLNLNGILVAELYDWQEAIIAKKTAPASVSLLSTLAKYSAK